MYTPTNVITIAATPTTLALSTAGRAWSNYIIRGTFTMTDNYIITLPTSNLENSLNIMFYYCASLSSYDISTAYLKIGNDKLPAEYAQKECLIFCQYSSADAAWKTYFIPDFTQSGLITSDNIVDGTIVAGDLATNAITTIKVTDGNITLPKIATQADQTILGNVSGGAASPIALTATQARTFLDQDVTLTGHITGTATQTFATGDTSISTTLANNVVTVAMLTNTVATELPPIPISFESGALTAGSAYIAVKMPYAATIEEYGVSVTELIEGTDDATVTIYNTAGVLMGTSSVTVTKGTKPSTTAAGGSFFNSSSITSDNSISAAALFYIRVQKVTAGGRAFANIKVKRA
jgi:hypothetical protein